MDSKLLYQALIEQHQALRDLKLQVESLKTMMFEHRPAFIETYIQIAARMAHSEEIKALDERIAELQRAMAELGA